MAIKTNGVRSVSRTKKLPERIKARRKMMGRVFALPEERAYPLTDAYHATLALSALMRVVGRHGVNEENRRRARLVLAAVRKRFPGVYAGEADIVASVKRAYGLAAHASGNPFREDMQRIVDRYG
jgi:hypothetical protein